MAEWLDTLSFLNLPVSLKNYVGGVPPAIFTIYNGFR